MDKLKKKVVEPQRIECLFPLGETFKFAWTQVFEAVAKVIPPCKEYIWWALELA